MRRYGTLARIFNDHEYWMKNFVVKRNDYTFYSTDLASSKCILKATKDVENYVEQKLLMIPDGHTKLVEYLDDISDKICRVADVSAYIIRCSDSKSFKRPFEESSYRLQILIDKLNTNRNLYQNLEKSIKTPSLFLHEDDFEVAKVFYNDFLLNGLHFDGEKKDLLLSYQKDILLISSMQNLRLEDIAKILFSRMKLANLLGFDSYSDFFLRDKMCNSTAIVDSVLNDCNREFSNIPQNVSFPILSVGHAIEMFAFICKKLFDIEFIPSTVDPCEVLDLSVRKVIVKRRNLCLGTVYFDLFRPQNPFQQPSHFTLRTFKKDRISAELSNPVIVVNISTHNMPSNPILMETIFHEMGHVIHSTK